MTAFLLAAPFGVAGCLGFFFVYGLDEEDDQ